MNVLKVLKKMKMYDAECRGLPNKDMYIHTQFAFKKTRSGHESIPFLGLSPGIHIVKFFTNKKSIIVNVKIWISLYGNAWQCLKNIEHK